MKYFYYCALVLFIVSCSKKSSNEFLTIEAEISEGTFNLSDVAEKITPIALETNDDCLISFVSRIVATKDYYFVLSSDLFQFSKQGKYIRKIGENGRGPNEYIRINSFTVNEQEGLIVMATGIKLIAYNFNGEIVKTTKFKKYVEYMSPTDEGIQLISTKMGVEIESHNFKNETTLYTIGKRLELKDSLLIKSIDLKKRTGTMFPGAQYISNLEEENYLYYPVLMKEAVIRDTLYRIENKKIKPSVKLHFNKNKDKHLLFKNIYRSNNFLFSEYNYNREQYFFCYDFTSKKQMNMKNGFNDDMLKTGAAKLMPLDMKSDLMIFVKDAYQVSEHFSDVTENDNPVLMVVKLKTKV